ncbi:MAG: hypothetical protein COB02_11975 [Candidatus Cloacimonadota bacterium]|nr:MAG: hypothetical protein COB02_11975 [Candidatus Cloacimonadota bacterium]
MHILNSIKFLLFIVSLSLSHSEEVIDTLDLDLLNKGPKLFQSSALPTQKSFFLLKQIFPSSTSSNESKGDGVIYPSLLSDNGKFRLYGTLGQVVTGSSEDSANFRMKAGFFTSNRKSVFKIRSIRFKRNPINIRR